MKLKIYSKKAAENADDKQLFLKLRYRPDCETDINVEVVNKKGQRIKDGLLMIFDQDNELLVLDEGVSEKIPLKVHPLYGHLITLTPYDFRLRKVADQKSGMDSILKRLLEHK